MSKLDSRRIALVTIDYPPLRTSAAVQMRDLAEEMLRQGHQPTVIVPSTDIDENWRLDDVNGVEVLRVKAWPTRDIGYARRTLNEMLLPLLMIRGLNKSPLSVAKFDLVAWYSPTIFFGPLIWSIKRGSGAHGYLILRDIFPEWAVDLGILRKGLIYWYFRAVAWLQYHVADTIGVQTESNLGYMGNWQKKPGRKLEVLHNWQHLASDIGCSINLGQTQLKGRKILAYIGNMGIAQGMSVLIDLARGLKDWSDIGLIFVGRGSEVSRLKQESAKLALANVLFFDEIPSEEIPGLLAQCHVGLLALDPRHKSHNIPGKFLSYLRAGLPVIAHVNVGTDIVSLINEPPVGRAFCNEPLEDMVQFVIALCENGTQREEMSVRAHELGEKLFSPAATVRQIVSRLDEQK